MFTNEERAEFRSYAFFGVKWYIALLGLVAIIGVAVWGFNVATSDAKGRGDALQAKNSGINRVAAQERFEDRYQEILATDRKIDIAANALAVDPEDPTLRTNYTGVVQYCVDIVGKYNADARKYSAEAFRADDLPAVIDNNDIATDCKENK